MKALNALMVIAVLGGAAPLSAQPMEEQSAEAYIRSLSGNIKEQTKAFTTRRESRHDFDQKSQALSVALAGILGVEGEEPCGEVIDMRAAKIRVDETGLNCGWRNDDLQWRISPEELKGSGFSIISGYLVQGDAIKPGAIVTDEELDAANARVHDLFHYNAEYRRAEIDKVGELAWTLAALYKEKGKLFACQAPADGPSYTYKPFARDGRVDCGSADASDKTLWTLTADDFKGTPFQVRADYLVYAPKAAAGDSVEALKRKGAYVSTKELWDADREAISLNKQNLKR